MACIDALKKVVKNGIVVLDDAGEVLAKYRHYLNGRGLPGVGDAFLRHIVENQYNPRKVRRQALRRNEDGSFADFPVDASLARFDPADRIFVALACAVSDRCSILNAVDSDYSIHIKDLSSFGVEVVELCPDCLRKG